MRSALGVALALTALSSTVAAAGVQNVSRVGRYLYTNDGNRFYIKGVAYQEQGNVVSDPSNAFGEPSSFIDPLANGTACQRDLPFLQELGVNTIRVYSVNASLNHDACMNAFSAAGIYTIIDLSLPLNGSIDRTSPSWSTNLLDLYIETINVFSANYDNVLAYNVGNEVVLQNSTDVSVFVKAAARDTKAYLQSKSYSALVGYADIDGASNWRDPFANYLSCDLTGTDSGATAIDLFGLNNYEWCGDSNFQAAYAGTNGDFAGYNIPLYFSEFGCITSPPRLWTEVGALFGSQMTDIWSGGIAFSYFPATSAQGQFGMVTISSDGNNVTLSADFNQLQTQYSQVSPSNSPSQSSAGNTNYPACPQQNSTFLASSSIPSTPNDAACSCLESALSCQFTPQTTNFTTIVGELLDTACSLLGQSGGTCDSIAGNGSTGTYGLVSSCDPTVKLSFVMSEYYEAQNKQPTACDFAGNATIHSVSASATAAASSCISSPAATFTPTAPAGAGSGSSSSGSSSGSSSSGASHNGGAAVLGDSRTLLYVTSLVAVGVASGLWTLA